MSKRESQTDRMTDRNTKRDKQTDKPPNRYRIRRYSHWDKANIRTSSEERRQSHFYTERRTHKLDGHTKRDKQTNRKHTNRQINRVRERKKVQKREGDEQIGA